MATLSIQKGPKIDHLKKLAAPLLRNRQFFRFGTRLDELIQASRLWQSSPLREHGDDNAALCPNRNPTSTNPNIAKTSTDLGEPERKYACVFDSECWQG